MIKEQKLCVTPKGSIRGNITSKPGQVAISEPSVSIRPGGDGLVDLLEAQGEGLRELADWLDEEFGPVPDEIQREVKTSLDESDLR